MAIGPDEVFLLILPIEGALFGLFTTLFVTTIHILVNRQRKTRGLNIPLVAVSVLLYVVAFAHLCLNEHRDYIAFIEQRDETPAAFLSRLTDRFYLAKEALYVVQTTIADTFLVYRLYIVWARDKRLLFAASIPLFASVVTGIIAVVSVAKASSETPIFAVKLKDWITSFFVITLFTNFSCTALIAFKVWWMERQLAEFSRSSSGFRPVMIIVIESGAVYSVSLIALLAMYINGTWAFYFIIDTMPDIIGVVFSLIIVRMSLASSSEKTRLPGLPKWQPQVSNGHTQSGQLLPTRPLIVQIREDMCTRDDNGEFIRRGSMGGTPSTLGAGIAGEKQFESAGYAS
ncbi:hypothetical protein M0805_008017 [Coniferiporia weirii]|nr:hypothetical protein M0805_008017 [Coniferiporia weirii]